MKSKRFRILLLVPLLAAFIMFAAFSMGATVAYADETDEITTTTPDTETGEDSDGNALQTLVDGFLAQLKAKYGNEYETYYNAIITEWGSVEEYLLSLVENGTIPDSAANGWIAFVTWLHNYAPVWGTILAVAAIIIVITLGKKALNKIVGFATGTTGKFKSLFGEINKIDGALSAQNAALMKLLGENQRFAEERKALEESSEEIQHE